MNQSKYPYWDSWLINPRRKVNMRLPYGRSVVGSFPYGGKRRTVTSPIKPGPYTGGSERRSFSLSPLAIKEAGLAAEEGNELLEAEIGFGKRLFSPFGAIADLIKSIRGAGSARPIGAVTGAGAPVRKGIPEGVEPTETKQIFVDEKGGKTTVTYKRAIEEATKKAITAPVEGAPSPTRDVVGELGPIGGIKPTETEFYKQALTEAKARPIEGAPFLRSISAGARPAIGEGMPAIEASKYRMWLSDPKNRLLLAGIAQAFGGPGARLGKFAEERALGELYKEALPSELAGLPGYAGPEFMKDVLAYRTGAEERARKAGLEERKMGLAEARNPFEMKLLEERAGYYKRTGAYPPAPRVEEWDGKKWQYDYETKDWKYLGGVTERPEGAVKIVPSHIEDSILEKLKLHFYDVGFEETVAGMPEKERDMFKLNIALGDEQMLKWQMVKQALSEEDAKLWDRLSRLMQEITMKIGRVPEVSEVLEALEPEMPPVEGGRDFKDVLGY